MSTSYLNDINIGEDLFDIIEDPAAFALSERSFTLQAGKTIPFVASLDNKTYEAEATLHQASLTRLSVLNHEVMAENRQTKIVTGVIRDVRMDITIDISGNKVGLANLLCDIVNKQLTSTGKQAVSWDLFVRTISRMGLPLVPQPDKGIDGTMPLLWQHFGADEAAISHAFDVLEHHGAQDAMPRNPGRIVRAVALPDDKGLPVVSMEINRADRSRSKFAGMSVTDPISGTTSVLEGTGFTDFVDAVVSNFLRGFSLRKRRRILEAKLNEIRESNSKNKTTDIEALTAEIKSLNLQSSRWMSNWGGAQRRVMVQPDGTATYTGDVDGVSAPSGRITVLDGYSADAEEVELNFWKNFNTSSDQSSDTTRDSAIDTTGMGNDDPF